MSQKLSKNQYKEAVKFTMDHFDSNKDLKLSRDDFKNMFAAASKGLDYALTEQIVTYLFNRFDRE